MVSAYGNYQREAELDGERPEAIGTLGRAGGR